MLRALSRSGMRLQAILDQIVEAAARLCQADSCFVYLTDGDLIRMRASFGQPQEVVEYERLHPDRPGPQSCTGRVAMTKRPVHIPETVERQKTELSRFLSPDVAALISSDEGAQLGDVLRRAA